MAGILVHEWLEKTGGAENVFEVLSDAFPDAERFCLWNDSAGRFKEVRETVLARTPLRKSKPLALPFMPTVWRHLPKREADWVLVSSHLFAHHAKFGHSTAEIPKFVYAHTPARYIWTPELDPRGSGFVKQLVASAFKPLDRHRAKEITALAANSQYVAERISNAWNREATVIYPPVNVSAFRVEPTLTDDEQSLIDRLPSTFLFAVSRWVPYKQLDRAISAGEASGMPVVIAGDGPDGERLRSLAASSSTPVVFIKKPSNELLRNLYRKAAVVTFAPIEDFGIVPVEAMAAGTPVLVNAVGGASESVVDGLTGVHIEDWDSTSTLRAAVDTALRISPASCQERAEDFSIERFTKEITQFVVPGARP